MVGNPLTECAEQTALCFVQSTAANPMRGSSLNVSAALTNSGFARLQCPHPGKQID